MLTTVTLHGEMADLFLPEARLDVSSLAEAVRALGAQLKGFRRYIIEHDFQVFLVRDEVHFLEEKHIGMTLPAGDIHIVPVLEGAAKGGGVAKLLAGLTIAAVAWWAAPALGAALVGGITYGNVAVFGVGLAIAGLSQLLASTPTTKHTQSFLINGATNTVEQGGPVPVIYGRTRASSVVISSGIFVGDIGVTSTGSQ